MICKRVSLLITTAVAATAFLGVLALPAQAALRHVDGTVVSKNSSDRSFRIKSQGGNRVRIEVTAATKFQRIAGFRDLHRGLRIEVEAKTTAAGLVAIQVETRQGGGGGDGGNGGADDGPNHG